MWSCPLLLREFSTGWRRYLTAFLAGALAALAFPPFNAIPVLLLSFPALVLLLDKTAGRGGLQAFAVGWSFAFGLLTVSLHWIAGALFVDIKSFWWVLPFAVAGLPALFAIYYGLGAMVAARLGVRGVGGALTLAAFWFLADWARGHWLTGFPWDITGYVWGDVLPVLQITSVIGIEGLGLLTLMLAVLPAAFFTGARRPAGWALATMLALFAGIALWGQARLNAAQTTFVPDVRLRLVQPSTDQAMKWRPEQRHANFAQLMALSFDQPGEKPVTHVIWPETASSFYLAEEPEIRAEIAHRLSAGAVLLTGVVRRQFGSDAAIRYYNSLIALNDKGAVVAGYDKHHLVPFGEYMPLRSVMPFRVVTALGVDFKAGEGIRTIRAPGLPPLSPLVCYEAIFSGEVAEREDPPHLLLNVTNDAWYEGTIGPAQHYAISRVRAIETGVPLVRAANKGVTAVTDSYGREKALVSGLTPSYIDSGLPESIRTGTVYDKQGNRPVWLVLGLLIGVLTTARAYAELKKKARRP